MDRDSKTLSLWQEVVPFINTNGNATHEDAYDVIVVGAGITGMTTALLLQEAGKKCLVLEARNIGFGTTSATTAHINTVLDTPYTEIIQKFGKENAKLVARAAKDAINQIKEKVDQYQIACDFEFRDGYIYAEDEEESKILDDIYGAIQQVGIDVAYANQLPVPVGFTKAIKFAGQAQFHPVKYLLALAEAFTEKGGIVIEGALVDKVDENDGIQNVQTNAGLYRARDVVYATHIPPGLNSLDFKCAPYRTYVLGIELNEEHLYPEALVYDSKDPYHYFRTAYLDDRKILIIGGNDHKTGHNENTEHIFTELEAYARSHYDIQSVPYKWSSQYYEPADGLPYIGLFPGGNDHLYVGTGYGGNGMIYGTLSGKILSDLILSGKNEYADLFSPARIKPVAAFKNFVKENFDVAKHFIADRFGIEKLDEFADIGKEEGRIVKYREENIAIYKDEYGVLKALSPVCPHAGCMVNWNNAEKSWDCPCHGARYDIDGALLNGPSTSPLKKIDLE
jgi:glycine/D-amino acid oxidase-like deaminating enzyme/nitrite reductase/ring-hydroxylating ferredoxin subunit